jgi:hypothetical protein
MKKILIVLLIMFSSNALADGDDWIVPFIGGGILGNIMGRGYNNPVIVYPQAPPVVVYQQSYPPGYPPGYYSPREYMRAYPQYYQNDGAYVRGYEEGYRQGYYR